MLNKFKLLINEETGQTIVLVTLLLVILLGFGAIVTDFGYMTYQKSNLQNAADAAVLAGAIELTKSTDSQVGVVVNEYANLNIKHKKELTIKPPVLDRAANTVEVEITQTVPKFLASVITSDTKLLTVRAKAKCFGQWDGDAMPFINLDDDYTKDPEIVAWEPTGPGDFESIWKDDFDIVYPNDPAKTYFRVNYEDGGITVTKGTVANIKQEVGYVFEQHKDVYIFSLSSEAINSYKYTNIKNKDVVPLKDLVLLKVSFHDYDDSGKHLFLTVKEVYNIADGVFPQDAFNTDTRVTSKLIK